LYAGASLHESGKATEKWRKCWRRRRLPGSRSPYWSCNPDPIGREKTDEELKTQVTALGELGRGLNTIGMKLGIHHHLPEMANKAREFHYNFRNTKPEEAGFCYDVHWVWKGGVSPMEALKEYGHRVATWHLRQSRNGIWWEDLDTGDIDYGAVAEYAREHKLPPVHGRVGYRERTWITGPSGKPTPQPRIIRQNFRA